VIPGLRTHRLTGSGDFWVPIVFTPGTNFVTLEGEQNIIQTPITRLANHFSKLLKPNISESLIIDKLRAPNGFQEMVNSYGVELNIPPGPRIDQVNFLIVIDQFEELFHPSNKGILDCNRLIQRVTEHYKNTHKSPSCKVFVVVTMRSEHLNDCTAFLDLPDVINMTSYLVRRLDPGEIDTAIESPARRFLILLQRLRTPKLPENFAIDSGVLAKLQESVEAIKDDPDHLPLLQHILARIWEASTLRVRKRGLAMADKFLPEDLSLAVNAGCGDNTDIPTGNLLRLSLENWAQALYISRIHDEQLLIDNILSCLAFKDPNTGMYTQQRINADDALSLLGEGQTIDDLKQLLDGSGEFSSFLKPFEYLFWDESQPSGITIKVSHESFIRGWSKFKEIIDSEAERFEEFLGLLREWLDWLNNNKNTEKLISGARLDRISDLKIKEKISSDTGAKEWFNLIALKTNGERFLHTENLKLERYFRLKKGDNEFYFYPDEIVEFISLSQKTEDENEARIKAESELLDKATKRSRVIKLLLSATIGIIAVGVLFVIPYTILTNRSNHFTLALSSTLKSKANSPVLNTVKEAYTPLEALLASVDSFNKGMLGQEETGPEKMIWDNFGNTFGQQLLFERFVDIYEPIILSALSNHLEKTIFISKINSTPTLQNESKTTTYSSTKSESCLIWGELKTGVKIFRKLDTNNGILAFKDENSQSLLLFNANLDENSCQVSNEIITSYPLFTKPKLAIDNKLKYIVSIYGNGNHSLRLQKLAWDSNKFIVQGGPTSVLLDSTIIQKLVDKIDSDFAILLESKSIFGGTSMLLDSENELRIVNDSPETIGSDTDWILLKQATNDSACGVSLDQLNNSSNTPITETTIWYEDGQTRSNVCYSVSKQKLSNDNNLSQNSDSSKQKLENKLIIHIYRLLPNLNSTENRNAVTILANLTFDDTSKTYPPNLLIGAENSKYKGWIGIAQPDNKLIVKPWSLDGYSSIARCSIIDDVKSTTCKPL
jgi:hypothetical protein